MDQIMSSIDAAASSTVDIFHTVYSVRPAPTLCCLPSSPQVRKQRLHMVQTRQQYEYLYRCVAHYLQCGQARPAQSQGSGSG